MAESFYASKDGESLLFDSNDYKEKIRTAVVFGTLDDLAKMLNKKYENLVVFCKETDFVIGKKAQNALSSIGKEAKLVTLNEKTADKGKLSSLLFGKDMLLAIGEDDAIELAKEVAKEKDLALATAYTSSKMTKAFCSSETTKSPDYLLVDTELYFLGKKKLQADTFAEVVSSLTDITDYKIASVKKLVKYDREAVITVIEAINYALSAQKFSSEQTALALSALKISMVREYSSFFDFSAVDKATEYISDGKLSYGELRYTIFKIISSLYRLYLKEEIGGLKIIPDTVKASKEITDYFNIKEYDFIREVSFEPSLKSISENEKIKSAVKTALLKDLDAYLEKSDYIEKLYSCIYSGKRKLSPVSPEKIKKAVKRASFTSKGNLLSMAKDDGFADYI